MQSFENQTNAVEAGEFNPEALATDERTKLERFTGSAKAWGRALTLSSALAAAAVSAEETHAQSLDNDSSEATIELSADPQDRVASLLEQVSDLEGESAAIVARVLVSRFALQEKLIKDSDTTEIPAQMLGRVTPDDMSIATELLEAYIDANYGDGDGEIEPNELDSFASESTGNQAVSEIIKRYN